MIDVLGANQMKLLTANLTGKALDWALAVALGKQYNCHPTVQDGIVWMPTKSIVFGTTNTEINGNNHVPFEHTAPALCLGLIKEHQIKSIPYKNQWRAETEITWASAWADTPEQAVARCVVAMRLGGEVDVPDELCGEQA